MATESISSTGLEPFKAPSFDESRVKQLAGQISTPQIGRLRRRFREISRQPFTNAAERAFALRRTLAGFGEGVSNITAGARQTAFNQLQPEFAANVQSSLQDRRFELDRTRRDELTEQREEFGGRRFGEIIPEGAGFGKAQSLFAAGARPGGPIVPTLRNFTATPFGSSFTSTNTSEFFNDGGSGAREPFPTNWANL